MIYIQRYDKDSKPLWNTFNTQAKNGLFMFDRNYMDYHSDRFCDHSLMFYENDKLLALLPLNVKDNVLYSHQGLTFGGFITKDSMRQDKMLECFESLQTYMCENGFSKLSYKAIPYIYHKNPAQEDLYALFRCGATLCRMDCSTAIDLRNPFKMGELRKRGAKKAQKCNVEVQESNDMGGFVALVNEVLEQRHNTKAVHNAQELELLSSRFPNEIKLFTATQSGKILAATLLFVYPNLIHTQYLATNEQGREIGALDLLLKTLIESYASSKTYFDFGISTEQNGLFLNSGLISQKEGFGGRTIVHNFYELAGGGGIYGVILLFAALFFYLTYCRFYTEGKQ